jgi:hypothetical protein
MDEAIDTIMISTTAATMMQAEYPSHYLKALMEHGLLDVDTAKKAALEYIETVNRFHIFVHMSFYDIEPFKKMYLHQLIQYIEFIQKHNLYSFKSRTPSASTTGIVL